MRLVAVMIVVTLAAATLPAHAQSFDCGYASLPTEEAICDSPYLSRLDQQMAELYAGLRDDLPPDAYEDLRASQARWLERRNACYDDIDCIAHAYRLRIRVLRDY